MSALVGGFICGLAGFTLGFLTAILFIYFVVLQKKEEKEEVSDMTENEAIKQLEFDKAMIMFDPTTGENLSIEYVKMHNKDNYLAFLADEEAIKALKEVQEYRRLGTVEEVREAVEKTKSKKRIEPTTELDKYYHESTCPNCGIELRAKVVGYTINQAIGEYNNCPWCGQRLESEE